ncbi:MAG TPA: hypothetical protein VLL25_00220, partial [Acidimicrobiales bacterium]|nr:hypothetical protein [Acidimicrobiales bacterium]
EEIAEPRYYNDSDEYWDHHSHATGPIAALIWTVSASDAEPIRTTLRSIVPPFQSGDSYAGRSS